MVDTTVTTYDREAAIASLKEILLESDIRSHIGKYYAGLILHSFETILVAENLFYNDNMTYMVPMTYVVPMTIR